MKKQIFSVMGITMLTKNVFIAGNDPDTDTQMFIQP